MSVTDGDAAAEATKAAKEAIEVAVTDDVADGMASVMSSKLFPPTGTGFSPPFLLSLMLSSPDGLGRLLRASGQPP